MCDGRFTCPAAARLPNFHHVRGLYQSELAYDLGQPQGAVELINVLREGVDANERRRARLLSGNAETRDFGPAPK
jgi:hypothetical protein